ncbi:MAG: hypothetical protein Q4E60_09835 [Bacteroidales bacterium]|nr:hypothetical protein [Bacteroidales bacterium]
MAELDNDKLKLESMLGCSISRTAGVQIPIDNNLPIHFPQSTIHYELYKNHVELHIEGSNYNDWAVDQDKQIERYVSTEIERGIPSEHIWVIYLTSDGRKQAESYSLTDHVLNILDDRYIELNYRNNILPWLKSDILPNCKLKEEWLISAIKQ